MMLPGPLNCPCFSVQFTAQFKETDRLYCVTLIIYCHNCLSILIRKINTIVNVCWKNRMRLQQHGSIQLMCSPSTTVQYVLYVERKCSVDKCSEVKCSCVKCSEV